MKTIHRDYSEEAGDFIRLCRFVSQNNGQMRSFSTWSLGRIVDWKYGLYPGKTAVAGFCEKNAHLWFDALGDLAAFAVSEDGDAGFAIITMEGYRFLFEEILQWALAAWRDRGPGFSIEITERQAMEAAILERYGFRLSSTFFTRRFDLAGELAPRFPVEPGFTIVDMATHPDYRAQRILRDEGFGGRRNVGEEELQREIEFYNHSHRGPIYHAPTDLCVMAPDGTFVACCEALIDARNAEADIERVCTHGDYRRRGFARAVIQECLYRLQAMGMHAAYIAGYSPAAIALYGSLGATDETRAYVYKVPAA